MLTLLFSFTTVSKIRVCRHKEYRFYKNIISLLRNISMLSWQKKGEIFLKKIKYSESENYVKLCR